MKYPVYPQTRQLGLKVLVSTGIALSLVVSGTRACGALALRTVALTGASPTLIEGHALDSLNPYFSAPVIDEVGRTAFLAWIDSKRGWVSESFEPGLRIFGVDETPTPGLPGGKFLVPVGRPNLSDSGHLAFRAFFELGEFYRDIGIWQADSDAQLILIARDGEPAPGTDYIFNSFGQPLSNRSGTLAFTAGISKSPYDSRIGVWTTRDGSLELVARGGDPIPGDTGATFNEFGRIALNNNNDVLFSASGLWLSTMNGQVQNVYRPGDLAPGTAARRFGGHAQQISLNDVRQVAFMDRLVESADDVGVVSIWRGTHDAIHLVALAGQPVPGVQGKEFIDFLSVDFNQQSKVAFVATYDQREDRAGKHTSLKGIWSDGFSTEIQLVAREGGSAAGVELGKFRWVDTISMNSSGQVAFVGLLEHILDPLPVPPPIEPSPRTGLITSVNDEGIWAQDQSGNLRLIVREGDLIDVANGPVVDLRKVNQLAFLGRSGIEEEGSGSFNDLGQLAFLAGFTDGTQGIFVSNAVAVPEPSTLEFWFVISIAVRWPIKFVVRHYD